MARRNFLKQAAAAAAVTIASPWAWAQAGWPSKPIRLIVPYAPGGPFDPVARSLGTRMSDVLGQPFIVENRPGGNTSLAATSIVKGDADGHTLLLTSVSTHAIHTVQQNFGYDALKDFAPIAALSRAGYMLAAHSSVPANTLPELVAYARANPDKLNIACSGIGNANHLAAELFKMSTGTKITVVPYKGFGAAITDVISGRVELFLTVISTLTPHIESGKLKAIAYTSQQPGMGPVPTFEQHGLRDFEKFESVAIFLAHARTPAPVVARLADVIDKALQTPEVRAGIQSVKQEPFYLPPKALGDRLAADRAKLVEIIDKAGIKMEA